MINNIKTFGKFLDQPILIAKLNKKMPAIMAIGSGFALSKYTKDNFKKANEEKKDIKLVQKEILKKGIILSSAVVSALCAPKVASFITKRTPLDTVEKVKEKNKELIDTFVKNHKINSGNIKILNKAKEQILSFKEVKSLNEKYGKNEFFKKLIPDPENIAAKDIFSEIGYLSIYGAIPVVGGILGGIGADIVQKNDYKKNIQDKICEGIYQYLANIFMCNIGAGVALGILEKLKITSKSARAIGMTTGIILTGVIGGSKIANFISKKIVQPMICPNKEQKERKPELVDIGLHTDDIATVSLLSGLKWIEPVLPVLYSVSGYKAGIGYRN